MNVTVTDTIKLQNVPSGSGIIKSGDVYYIVGDDSPFLFCLNNDFKIISKIHLLDNHCFSERRIQKSEKSDFETLELIDQNEIVIFGSGSKTPQRDIFIRILLNDSLQIEKYHLTDFYNNLRKLAIFKDSELNIEAATYHNNQLYLFNRKKNLIIKFEYSAFLDYLKNISSFPKIDITEFSLPKINGIEAGFSGATILKAESKIIFTATVEDTDNAYDDGEILGSFVGLIPTTDTDISDTFYFSLIPDEGVKLKVESVCVEDELSKGNTKVIFVTDDDKGNSIILKGLLRW